ncbi:hypothetical protein C8J56DRAFT_778794, partial [Mycena floridula]
IDKVLEELARQNQEQREYFNEMVDALRQDALKQHDETLKRVAETANERIDFNVQGYLDDFSKALASEVRILLNEVGKLREERRALEHQLGELLIMKSKYGPGGEYDGNYRPPPGPGHDMPPEPPMPPEIPSARPAWRSVHQRPPKKQKKKESAPPMHQGQERQQIQSWTAWHRKSFDWS